MLVVVQGSGLHNICVVVVRYFGGTKLGTGGLVRAYTECAQGALRATQRGREIEVVSIGIVMEYADYDRFQYLLRDFWTDEMDRNFGEKVDVLFTIGFHEFERLQRSLDELSNGRLEAIILERKRKVIPIDTGNS